MKKSISTTQKLLFLVPLLALLFTAFSSTASAHSVSGVGPRPVAHKTLATQSSPPCDATSCYTYDPYSLGCPGDYTKSVGIYLGTRLLATIWNVWSSYCRANWVEGQLSPYAVSSNMSLTISIQDIPSNLNQNPPKEEQCYPTSCPTAYGYPGSLVAWSNMIDGQPLTKATGTVWGVDTGNGNYLGSNSIDR